MIKCLYFPIITAASNVYPLANFFPLARKATLVNDNSICFYNQELPKNG